MKIFKKHVPLRAKYNLETLLGRDFHGVEIASWKERKLASNFIRAQLPFRKKKKKTWIDQKLQ